MIALGWFCFGIFVGNIALVIALFLLSLNDMDEL
jgi:hypothetical protein